MRCPYNTSQFPHKYALKTPHSSKCNKFLRWSVLYCTSDHHVKFVCHIFFFWFNRHLVNSWSGQVMENLMVLWQGEVFWPSKHRLVWTFNSLYPGHSSTQSLWDTRYVKWLATICQAMLRVSTWRLEACPGGLLQASGGMAPYNSCQTYHFTKYMSLKWTPQRRWNSMSIEKKCCNKILV